MLCESARTTDTGPCWQSNRMHLNTRMPVPRNEARIRETRASNADIFINNIRCDNYCYSELAVLATCALLRSCLMSAAVVRFNIVALLRLRVPNVAL